MSDIGLYGLGVMGENLAMNIEGKGYTVSVCNYMGESVREFAEGRGKGHNFVACVDEREFVLSIERPRRIFVMIRAGAPVDETFDRLSHYMSEGDIFIDGGNSDYRDTCRRVQKAEGMGLKYVGTGVSGGELGALYGPSIMPGGSDGAWQEISGIFSDIAARGGAEQSPCTAWMGSSGSGHLVKTVHNGIEYGDMQLICEAYDLMRRLTDADTASLGEVFAHWNTGALESYLIEITAEILATKDSDGSPLVEHISDRAMQKGTGRWAAEASLAENVPLTLITEAVYARILSSKKEERKIAFGLSDRTQPKCMPLTQLTPIIERALYCAKIISYAQGFSLIQTVSQRNEWGINLADVARIWRGGCIIRSTFLEHIDEAYRQDPKLANLMIVPFFSAELRGNIDALREAVCLGVQAGIPLPCMSAALAFYDGYHCDSLPANLLQAQRDYFGAHMFERIDRPQGEFFHHNWTGAGGSTHSTVYER